MKIKKHTLTVVLCLITFSEAFSQELDVDELLERLDRIEKNISDLQKGRFDEIEKSLSTGYISRNESRLGDFETKLRTILDYTKSPIIKLIMSKKSLIL